MAHGLNVFATKTSSNVTKLTFRDSTTDEPKRIRWLRDVRDLEEALPQKKMKTSTTLSKEDIDFLVENTNSLDIFGTDWWKIKSFLRSHGTIEQFLALARKRHDFKFKGDDFYIKNWREISPSDKASAETLLRYSFQQNPEKHQEHFSRKRIQAS